MPASSTISSAHKSLVKAALPSSSYKIITATVARVYADTHDSGSWDYSGVEGALALVRDLTANTFRFMVVDLKQSRGVVWQHELYEPFQYNQDRTFFHSFQGDEFCIGFSFADDGEAGELFKKVSNRQKYAKSAKAAASSSSSSKKKKAGGSVKIDKSMISAPSGFKHVAHMGYSAEKGFSSDNVDPSWSALLDQLTNMGVSRKDIEKNEGFIKDFVGRRGGPTKAAGGTAPKAKKVPPPAPSRAPAGGRKSAPPPPAPRRVVPPSAPSAAAAPPPPPPPPPARSGAPAASAAPPPPPPPPVRGGAAAPTPPRPPPPPARGGGAAPPPPPPPPPASGAGAGGPPPPPPPPATTALPPPQSGRANLLASIQGAGVHQLRKTDANASPGGGLGAAGTAGLGAGAAAAAGGAAMAASASGGGDDSGGGDLASALAAALNARKENMGDSDEEESDDDW